MGRTQDPGGDYGYDLVHEDVRSAAGPPDDGDEPRPAPAPDGGGDHGYDEAHDF